MQRVLVLDKSKNPLMACHSVRARQLLKQGKAAVFREYPFTIILKERDGGDVQPVSIKIDPGSKTTGISMVADFKGGKRVIWAGELTHRGQQIRDKLLSRRQVLGLPLEVGTGGRTKFNRVKQHYPKAHWIDAICVGESGGRVIISPNHAPLQIRATGHQSRQMCRVDKYGFPRTSAKQGRVHFGFQTGDIVKAIVTKGVKYGTYIGKVSVRSTGFFNITTPTATVQGISYRYCTPIHNSDGYLYQRGEALSSATTRVAVSSRQDS